MGSWDDDGADLAEGEHHHPPLIAAFQDEHHGVVLADAQRHQVTGGLVRLFLQLTVGRANLFALIVCPQDGQLLRGLLCPRVHHVVGEIEVLGDDELQVLVVVFNRRELRLF